MTSTPKWRDPYDHKGRFSDARFAALAATTDTERVQYLTECINQLGYIISELHNIAHNAHTRLEAEQPRIKALEEAMVQS